MTQHLTTPRHLAAPNSPLLRCKSSQSSFTYDLRLEPEPDDLSPQSACARLDQRSLDDDKFALHLAISLQAPPTANLQYNILSCPPADDPRLLLLNEQAQSVPHLKPDNRWTRSLSLFTHAVSLPGLRFRVRPLFSNQHHTGYDMLRSCQHIAASHRLL